MWHSGTASSGSQVLKWILTFLTPVLDAEPAVLASDPSVMSFVSPTTDTAAPQAAKQVPIGFT